MSIFRVPPPQFAADVLCDRSHLIIIPANQPVAVAAIVAASELCHEGYH